MSTESEIAALKEAVEESKELLEENNQMLRSVQRNARLSFWFQVLWYGFLIGMPFALYFYILEPYFSALGSSYETFNAGMQEIPGWKQFHETLKIYRGE